MPTEAQIMERFGQFLVAAGLPEANIVQGQVNRVPPPGSDLYVVFWNSARRRIATNTSTYDDTGEQRTITTPMNLTIQVDVHGSTSADEAQRVYQLWRDPFACDFMGGIGQPLYSDDPVQIPFWDGENQTENRWVCYVHLQANMTVELPQEFADTLDLFLVEVDSTFPPD